MEESFNDDENFVSGLEYSKKSEFSKARLVEEAIKKVIDSRAQEMREGYYNYKIDNNGNLNKIYIPDSRKIYIGAVEALKSILSPEILMDEEIKKKINQIEKKIKELFNKYSIERVRVKDGEIINIKRKYIPELDEGIPIKTKVINNGMNAGYKIKYKYGIYNKDVKEYWDNLLKLYDEIFSWLNILIAGEKINFFKQKASY